MRATSAADPLQIFVDAKWRPRGAILFWSILFWLWPDKSAKRVFALDVPAHPRLACMASRTWMPAGHDENSGERAPRMFPRPVWRLPASTCKVRADSGETMRLKLDLKLLKLDL